MQDQGTRRCGGRSSCARVERTRDVRRTPRHQRWLASEGVLAAPALLGAAMLAALLLGEHAWWLPMLGAVTSGAGGDGDDSDPRNDNGGNSEGSGDDHAPDAPDEEDDEYEAGHEPVALRSVGVTQRRKRILVRGRELFLAARRELLTAVEKAWDERARRAAVGEDLGPEPEPLDERALWEQSVEEAQSVSLTPRELELYNELAPGLMTEEALNDVAAATGRRVSRKVVLAAVCRHSLIVGLRGYLPRKTGSRGPTPARKLISCAFLLMAFGRGRPCLVDAAEDFRGDPLLAWAFGYPDDDVGPAPTPDGGGFWGSHKAMLRAADDTIPNGIQVEAWLELARQKGLDENGNEVPLYPRAGETLIVDYSFVEADVEQAPAKERDPVLDALINGAARPMVRFLTYASDGRFRRKNRGYKVGLLLCPDTTAAPKVDVQYGAVYEPRDAVRMLEELLRDAPDFPPVRHLLGDRLYAGDRDVMRTLLWRFGVIPKFSPRNDDPDMKSKGVDWPALEKSWREGAEKPDWLVWRGVPHCTTCKLPMRLDGWADKFWSQEARIESMRRRAAGELGDGEKVYERDQWVDREAQRARLRFICDGCRQRAHVRPDVDPRVFSPLPWVGPEPESLKGESDAVARGRALLMRRNAVESWLAALQRLGLAGKGMERPAWARDHDMKWLLELGAAFLTLRKLVLVNGAYEFALGQARALGLLRPMTRRSPGIRVDADALERAEAAWSKQVGVPRMPRRWRDVHGGLVYEVPYGDPAEDDWEWDDPLDAGVRGDVEHNDAVAAGLRSVLAGAGARGIGAAGTRLRDRLNGRLGEGDAAPGDAGNGGDGEHRDGGDLVGRARRRRRVRRIELADRPRTLNELLPDDIEMPLPDC